MFNLSLSLSGAALAPGMGVAVYAGLMGALLLCVILVLCVGVLAYRRRCRHLHADITDSSSALTAAFHPGNYKPPRQGERARHTPPPADRDVWLTALSSATLSQMMPVSRWLLKRREWGRLKMTLLLMSEVRRPRGMIYSVEKDRARTYSRSQTFYLNFNTSMT